MGMFDTFITDIHCPACQHEIKDMQTKSLECMLNEYKAGDALDYDGGVKLVTGTIEVYDICKGCKGWIVGEAEIVDNRWTGNVLNLRADKSV